MSHNISNFKSQWENDEVRVNVPFSAAGVGTTIVLTSKFTGKMMMLDVGDGVLRDLLLFGSTDFVDEIDPIAISHGHFDHVGGLHSLLGFMQMLDRKNPLNILIPTDCKQAIGIIKNFRDNYGDSIPFKICNHEMVEGSGFDTDFFKVQSIEVEHYSLEKHSEVEILEPSLGYRVQIGQTLIAYTGDTRLCSGVETIVRDADLAIIEATRRETPSGPRVHLSINEAEDLGKLAKNYMLIHKIPEMPS
ncbi:MAG: ribonuclease Z [Candidatus Thorarchaeota archaeon]|nr:MAG: ribonuclease Z [Candidatus Thorarchaeota archaeon]